MSVSFSLNGEVAVVVTTDDFDFEDLRGVFTDLRDELEDQPRPRILVDDPGSNFQPSADTLRQVIELWAKLFAGRSPRVALLVAKPVHYGLGRMMAVFAEERGVDFGVFRDRAEALSWLETRSPSEQASAS